MTLKSFPTPETDHIATFETDELTAMCPFDFGGPDFYHLTIRYRPKARCIESRSLKKWLQSYRGREISAEALAGEIYQKVSDEITPDALYIRLEQARRGGIEETVEVGDVDL